VLNSAVVLGIDFNNSVSDEISIQIFARIAKYKERIISKWL